MKCTAWSRSFEWNTDPIETAELEDLIGQTSQFMHSGEEHHDSQGDHAHELPQVQRCAVDEAHDLTTECQARGGCKGCAGVPRGSLTVRISDCQPDRPIVVASGGVLRYTHVPTPLDDSTSPLDKSSNSTVHNPQRALVTSIILDGGSHGWVPVNTHSTPVLPKEEAVVARKALHLHEPNHKGNGRSIHNSNAVFCKKKFFSKIVLKKH